MLGLSGLSGGCSGGGGGSTITEQDSWTLDTASGLYYKATAGFTDNNSTLMQYADYMKAGYKFSNGDLLVDSIGSNPLTNGNTVTNPSTGKDGYCAEFDGSNQYLSAGTGGDLVPSAGVAVSAWVNFDTTTGSQAIFNKNNSYQVIYWDNSNRLYARIWQSDNTAQAIATGSTPSASAWNHVCLIADSTALKVYFYLNGTETGTPIAYDGTLQKNTDDLLLGAETTSATFFNGRMDEVYIWNNPVFASDTDRESFVTALQTAYWS